MSVSSCYQSHPNNHSTEEPRLLGLPIRGQITISTARKTINDHYGIAPFLRILLHGVSKFILSSFFFKITKNTRATKSCCTQNYRIMQSHDTICANSPTLPVVQPQSFNSIFKPLATSFHPTPASKSTLQPQRSFPNT